MGANTRSDLMTSNSVLQTEGFCFAQYPLATLPFDTTNRSAQNSPRSAVSGGGGIGGGSGGGDEGMSTATPSRRGGGGAMGDEAGHPPWFTE